MSTQISTFVKRLQELLAQFIELVDYVFPGNDESVTAEASAEAFSTETVSETRVPKANKVKKAWKAIKTRFMSFINGIGNILAAPFRAAGGCATLPFRIGVFLWNGFWNLVGCGGIFVITLVLACTFLAFPGPGWVAFVAFSLIYVITTVWWLAKRAYNKAHPEARDAKRALTIGFVVIILSGGSLALPVAMCWAMYAMHLNRRAKKREAARRAAVETAE